MRKFYILLFIAAVLLVGLLQNAVSDSQAAGLSGLVQRCDTENGCPGEAVAGATVTLQYHNGQEWVNAFTPATSSPTGHYSFIAAANSTEYRIMAAEGTWSTNWYYITTPAEGDMTFNLMTDLEINQCGCN